MRDSGSVSIVIVNKDERSVAGTLQALESLFQQEEVSEVLVVDASLGRLDDIKNSFPLVRWIDYVPPMGVKTSIAHQRNIGVSKASGDIVVFVDSGCIPAPDWCKQLLKPIRSGEELVTCGPAISRDVTIYSGSRWRGSTTDQYVSSAPTINMAFRRQAFDAVGGFDERFEAGEDIDFTWRLIDHGMRLRWLSEAAVQADWGDRRRQARRSYSYGNAWYRLLRKHPDRLGETLRTDPVPLVYALFLLGSPLMLRWKWYPGLLSVALWRQRNEAAPAATMADHLLVGAGFLVAMVRER